jgi:hypothetical protein
MPLLPAQLEPVANAIGDAFTSEQIQDIVLKATGNGLFKQYAGDKDPLRLAVRKTLEQLAIEGHERWLLTHVLIVAIANEGLRRLIVKACPETLVSLPSADKQVDSVLHSFSQAMAAVLKPEFIFLLRPSRESIAAISAQIMALSAYKDLHECLHGLHLKVAFTSTAEDTVDAALQLAEAADCQKLIDAALTKANQALAKFGGNPAGAQVERDWIAELERLAANLRIALAASNIAAVWSAISGVKRLIRLQLTRLNKSILEIAQQLSLEPLVVALPDEFRSEAFYHDFSHAVRDLTPTVLARALEHKLWQDTENEIALIESYLDQPDGNTDSFAEHWLLLRHRALWLATLDPDADWSKTVRKTVEDIELQLTDEKHGEAVTALFDSLFRQLRFRFFAVDATLKSDCGSLGKMQMPLKSFVDRISRG